MATEKQQLAQHKNWQVFCIRGIIAQVSQLAFSKSERKALISICDARLQRMNVRTSKEHLKNILKNVES